MLLFCERPSLLAWSAAVANVARKAGLVDASGTNSDETGEDQEDKDNMSKTVISETRSFKTDQVI